MAFNIDRFLKIYPATSDEEAWKASAALLRDSDVRLSKCASGPACRRKPGRLRRIFITSAASHTGPVGEHYSAFHASEISYVFGTGDIGKTPLAGGGQRIEPRDVFVLGELRDYRKSERQRTPIVAGI